MICALLSHSVTICSTARSVYFLKDVVVPKTSTASVSGFRDYFWRNSKESNCFPPLQKATPMEGNHTVGTGHTRSEDSWTCNRCGWVYPNPHPSAKHRRNHKKHCGKIKGFEIQQEHEKGGSSGETSSDDDHGNEGVEHNVAANQVVSLASPSEPEKSVSVLPEPDAKPDRSLPAAAAPFEEQSTVSGEGLSQAVSEVNIPIEKTYSSNMPQLSEFSSTEHDSVHSSDVKVHSSEDSGSRIPVSTSYAPSGISDNSLPNKISEVKGDANELVHGEPSQLASPNDTNETVVPIEISETASIPDPPNIVVTKNIMLAKTSESDSGYKTSNDAVVHEEQPQSDAVVEGNLSRALSPSDTKESTESVDSSEINITTTFPNVDLTKHATTESDEMDSRCAVTQEQPLPTHSTLEDNCIAAISTNKTTELVDSSVSAVSSATQSEAVTEHLPIDDTKRNSEIKVVEQGPDVINELNASKLPGGGQDISEECNQSFVQSNPEDVVHKETDFTSSENYQHGATRSSHLEQGSDNIEGSSTKLQEVPTIKDLIIVGSETESILVQQQIGSLPDAETVKDTDEKFSPNIEGGQLVTTSRLPETVIAREVKGTETAAHTQKLDDIQETSLTYTVTTVEQISDDKAMPKRSAPEQDSTLAASRASESEKQSVPQQDNVLAAGSAGDKAMPNQNVPQQDNAIAVGFEVQPAKETVLQHDNILPTGNSEDKAYPNQNVAQKDNVKAVGCEAESENQSANSETVEASLKKSHSIPESSTALTEQSTVAKISSKRRSDSMDTETYEDAPDTLEACSVAGSVAGSIEENDIFQSLSDTSARLDAVPSFREKEKNGDESPENPSYLAEKTSSFPTKGVFDTEGLNLKAPSPEAWQESEVGSGKRNGGNKEEELRQRKDAMSTGNSDVRDAGKSQTALGSLMAKEAPERTKSSTTGPPKQKSKSFWAHCICCATVH